LLSDGNALLQQAANSGSARAATAIESLKPKLKVSSYPAVIFSSAAPHVLSMQVVVVKARCLLLAEDAPSPASPSQADLCVHLS